MSSRRLPLLLLVVAFQLAHADEDASGGSLLDCDHPPKDLAQSLPKQLASSATILCTPSTQMIVAPDGWAWRFPGSFFDRPSIPAFAPVESRSTAGGRYFTSFKATDLSGSEVRALHEKLAKTVATYAEAGPPARVVKLLARNDQGFPMDAYFGFKTSGEGWVALCAPDCAPEFFFLIKRHD